MLPIIFFLAGLFLLTKGADFLVDGASALARRLKISPLVIGLTIVAFGTSLPELIVNVVSATNQQTDVALGNIVGSNISNIWLILGISALIGTLHLKKSTTWKEVPFSLLGVIVLIILSFRPRPTGFYLDFFDGLLLLSFFSIFIYYTFQLMQDSKDFETEIAEKTNQIPPLLLILAGLILLYVGGVWTVDAAVSIATSLGISTFLISITIVAVGTSLPELVTSIVAAQRKESDLAVGNIVGSNIFNIFFILGITSLIAPVHIPAGAHVDLVILLFSTVTLFLAIFTWKQHQLGKREGVLFFILYLAYLAFVIYRAIN